MEGLGAWGCLGGLAFEEVLGRLKLGRLKGSWVGYLEDFGTLGCACRVWGWGYLEGLGLILMVQGFGRILK